MSNNIWPFRCGDQLFNAPTVNGNKCTVNDIKLVDAVQKHPKLFTHMITNRPALSNELSEYINNISEKFEPEIPKYALGRLKVAENEWQEQEENRYVELHLLHCENYANHILPFHDPDHQYCFFYVNMIKSVNNGDLSLYWDREREPNGYEEWIWASSNDVEIIYLPEENNNNDEFNNKKMLGFKDTVIHYLKKVNNIRLVEFIAMEDDTFIILFYRLRSRIRNGFHGKIVSVQGIIPESIWDGMCEKLEDIADEDDKYSKNINIISYKLSRNQLFTKLKVNPIYILKFYDDYGKEMKLIRNASGAPLYDDISSYTLGCKQLAFKIANKHAKKKKNRVIQSFCGFNGVRLSFNLSTKSIKLTTNNFESFIEGDGLTIEHKSMRIKETLGRKSGW